MKLAFWKGKPSRGSPADSAAGGVQPDFDSAPGDGDADEARVDQLRVRARRRLVGAAALLLLVVVLVPMLLDPTPRAVPDNIPIALPSERTPFAPKPPAPPVEAPSSANSAASVPAAPGSAADAAAVAGEGQAGKNTTGAAGAAKPETKPAPAHKAEAHEGAGRFIVQAAALAKESAARDLASRLGKSGLATFVERTESNGNTRYRVRLGPFATRDDAERARARLHELGVSSNIVGV
jgi:DedD protein